MPDVVSVVLVAAVFIVLEYGIKRLFKYLRRRYV
jgi:hypothetical protein